MVTFLWGRYCWKFLSAKSSEWKARINTEMLWGRGMAWNQGSGARAGKLARVQESGPGFGIPFRWDCFYFPFLKKLVFLNCTHCWMDKRQLSCLISIWVKQPRVHLKVIWTIWACWDVMKAGNLMKTGFLLKFLALPFLVLFGETPRAHFLPIFHFGMSVLGQIRETSKEQWKWKIKIRISILSNSKENNSPHGLKAFSKGVGKSTSHFSHWFNEFQDFYNIHRYLGIFWHILSHLCFYNTIDNLKTLFQIVLNVGRYSHHAQICSF